jgi:hypothetical protein
MEVLHWLEWMGLSFAAYGIVAGAVRGFTPQFTRFCVWAVVVAVVGFLGFASRALAGSLADAPAQQIQLEVWLELALILSLVFLVGAFRRLLFGWIQFGGRMGDRLLGAGIGLCSSLIAWLVLVGAAENFQPGVMDKGLYARRVAQGVATPFVWFPNEFQLRIFHFSHASELISAED